MSQEIKYPINVNFWTAKNASGKVIHEGMTEPDQVTTTGQSELVGSDNADGIFPELPKEGQLKQGDIYSYNGGMVIIEQDHERTIYPPQETPALITFYRKEVGRLQWIPNEQVEAGMSRWYKNIEYEVITGHLTQVSWGPTNAPTLWKVHEEAIPVWKQPTGAHDAYNIGDSVHFPTIDDPVYESKIDGNTWSPTGYAQGWKKI